MILIDVMLLGNSLHQLLTSYFQYSFFTKRFVFFFLFSMLLPLAEYKKYGVFCEDCTPPPPIRARSWCANTAKEGAPFRTTPLSKILRYLCITPTDTLSRFSTSFPFENSYQKHPPTLNFLSSHIPILSTENLIFLFLLLLM